MPGTSPSRRLLFFRRDSAPALPSPAPKDLVKNTLNTLAMLKNMGYREVWTRNDEVNPEVLTRAFAEGWAITDAQGDRIKFSLAAAPQALAATAPLHKTVSAPVQQRRLPPPTPPPNIPLPPTPTLPAPGLPTPDTAQTTPRTSGYVAPLPAPPLSPNMMPGPPPSSPRLPNKAPKKDVRPRYVPMPPRANSLTAQHLPRISSPLSSHSYTFDKDPSPPDGASLQLKKVVSAQSGLIGRRVEEVLTPTFVLTRPETPQQPAQGYFDFRPMPAQEEMEAAADWLPTFADTQTREALNSYDMRRTARSLSNASGRSFEFTVSRSNSSSSSGSSSRRRTHERMSSIDSSTSQGSGSRAFQMPMAIEEEEEGSFEFDDLDEANLARLNAATSDLRLSPIDPEIPLDGQELQRRHAALARLAQIDGDDVLGA